MSFRRELKLYIHLHNYEPNFQRAPSDTTEGAWCIWMVAPGGAAVRAFKEVSFGLLPLGEGWSGYAKWP